MGFISELFGYLLNVLYDLINNYGIAIIIFSVLLRVILIPITIKQQKSMKNNSKIQKEMKSIQIKYKNNPEELNKATMELYKREGVSPFSGCLTAILQIIIILAVFWLVSQPLTYMKKVQNTDIYNEYKTSVEENTEGKSAYKEISIINKVEEDYKKVVERLENKDYKEEAEISNNEEKIQENNNENIETEEKAKIKTVEELQTKEELEKRRKELEELRINMNFLGLDLSKVPTSNLKDWKVYIIPVLYVITSFISIRITTKMQNSKNKEDLSEQEESMQQMNKSMSYMMPIMSISIAAIAPLGLALYWLVSNVLMIVERLIINKFINPKEEEENV